jgi:putative aldouronate transport system permease protein
MIRDSFNDRLFGIFNYGFMTFMLLLVLYPLVYIVSASVSEPSAVSSGEMWLWPVQFTWEGYDRVFRNEDIWLGYRNTIIYTLLGVAIKVGITIPGAYALARQDFVGRHFFTFIIVFTMFFQGGLIPTYLLVKDLNMLNTPWALILPSAVTVFNIIVVRTFFQSSVPRQLEEAAEIDGCSIFTLFFRIVLPLSMPIIVVMALFYGVGIWNQYFPALLYLSDRELYPLQLILREVLVLAEASGEAAMRSEELESLAREAEIANIMKYAIILVSALPMIILYPFLQRFFIKGMLIGSLKG